MKVCTWERNSGG